MSSILDHRISEGTSFFLGYNAYEARFGKSLNDKSSSSTEQQPQLLLDAIIGNAVNRVKNILSRGLADPNTCLGIGPSVPTIVSNHDVAKPLPLGETHANRSTVVSTAFKVFAINRGKKNCPSTQTTKIQTLDKVFSWARVFGDAPTFVHLAILNIYHRHKRPRQLKQSLVILEMLLEHGGAVNNRSMNIHLGKNALASNPLDFALGVQRKALYQRKESLALAMTQAVGILRRPCQGQTNYDSSLAIETNEIPFELFAFECLNSVNSYLFQATEHEDIKFVFRQNDIGGDIASDGKGDGKQ